MTPERWRQVSALFDAALVRDDATRARYLEGACAGDQELRAEVEALLDAHHRAGSFGQNPIRGVPTADPPPLAAGRALGPYQIEALLGEGGMGQVYRATDTRLGRTVAIKVLPQHLAVDGQLRGRFEREARTVASLSHPHICPLFDLGEQDGIHFLVMEYLEGQTLEDRLKSGGLSLPQALRYAVQIADALDKAHRRGIVHRDLKPANIMLTTAGAKLLDFGLAKPHGAGSGPIEGRTPGAAVVTTLTGQGSLVGTLPYMAPEQVQGRDTDGRTDIFAFGSVLYEMVTGEGTFESHSGADLIAAILNEEVPRPSQRQPLTPPALDRVIQRCLAKDPEERWQSAGDLRHELQTIAAQPIPDISSASLPGRPQARHKPERLWWAAAALVAGAVGTWVALASWGISDPVSPQVIRFPISLPLGLRPDSRTTSVPIAVSPRGDRIVFSAVDANDNVQLYVRESDRAEIRALPGTEGGFAPFFSPDGAWVGFAASGSLKKVATAGGPAVTIADKVVNSEFGGGTWGSDGTIVFAPSRIEGLARIAATGGIPESVTAPDRAQGEVSHFLPQFLPGGGAVLFTLRAGLNRAASRIEVVVLDTGERRVIAKSGINARYATSGHVVFGGDASFAGSLWAVPFDVKSLRPTGPEVRVVDSLSAPAGLAQFALAESGTLISVPRAEKAPQELVWVDATKRVNTLVDTPGSFLNPRLSPDGKRVAVTIMGQGDPSSLWVVDRDRPRSPLLFSKQSVNDHIPVWTRDGTRLVFSSLNDGTNTTSTANLYWKRIDDRGQAERLTRSGNHQDPASWSPDGRFLTFAEQDPKTRWDVWVLDIEQRAARPLLRTPARETSPMVSPDGKWLAYSSDETGQFEVYVVSFPGAANKQRISDAGGNQPLWSHDGRRLFYRRAKEVVAVDVRAGARLAAGQSEVVVEGTYEGLGANGAPNYDVSADGRSFLMIRQGNLASIAQTQLDVVVNWTSELGSRARPSQ